MVVRGGDPERDGRGRCEDGGGKCGVRLLLLGWRIGRERGARRTLREGLCAGVVLLSVRWRHCWCVMVVVVLVIVVGVRLQGRLRGSIR